MVRRFEKKYLCAMKRVVVGLSGGVDSSVAAYLLKEQGYEVIAIFMRNWHDDSVIIDDECPWIDDSNDAIMVAEHLGIPFQVMDLSIDYKERIVDYMFKEYQEGRTPNPDVLCNREIKFDLFLKAAMDLRADFVATGHYCRKREFTDKNGKVHYELLAGADNNKDQSYFLCQLNQEQLSKALFPIGELSKPEVRKIAAEAGFVTAEKKDSQGLCFIGKVKLPTFLQQQLKPKTGAIHIVGDEDLSTIVQENPYREADFSLIDSQEIGTHQGAHYFTVGQRRGLHVGGRKQPVFVIGTDVETNIIYVGEGEDHWALNRSKLMVAPHEIHWIDPINELQVGESKTYFARIRYRQSLSKALLTRTEDGLLFDFEEEQKGVAAGQFVAWYENESLIGSGVIMA